ncbi:50S ribosomal protein L18 [Enterobacteriaceae endosymbiont of Macroplea mutica]|uniref:50S ribosomal protein L18 n=1 Tax=Enterobacteriaceae endosymbiont of Macroplea mutica TaxID=2675791 RepID=UPI001449F532|nr:50S ribosomal protein L18 [Enterobacteriaceae endosymbiont of Macroplea mutica]QJC31456.1 50S ribosomal protein L18 [Enterobacteriaceae endosymbiont of Macroplea mutica]
MKKNIARMKRAKKLRKTLVNNKNVRLVIHRTSRHIYAQIFDTQNIVLVTSSTVEKKNKITLSYTGNIQAAGLIGQQIAKRAIQKGIIKISFDRSGFKYHGRVKALAEAARSAGLQF